MLGRGWGDIVVGYTFKGRIGTVLIVTPQLKQIVGAGSTGFHTGAVTHLPVPLYRQQEGTALPPALILRLSSSKV